MASPLFKCAHTEAKLTKFPFPPSQQTAMPNENNLPSCSTLNIPSASRTAFQMSNDDYVSIMSCYISAVALRVPQHFLLSFQL